MPDFNKIYIKHIILNFNLKDISYLCYVGQKFCELIARLYQPIGINREFKVIYDNVYIIYFDFPIPGGSILLKSGVRKLNQKQV